MKALQSVKYGRFAKHGERKTGQHGRRLISLLLCLCMVVSMMCNFGGWVLSSAVAAEATGNVMNRKADPNTMDDYLNQLLSKEWGSRYAGRIWTDKSVFAFNAAGGNLIPLDMETDGYTGNVGFNADFAHVFSALASSQTTNAAVPIDLMLALDITASMLSSESNMPNTNTDIDSRTTWKNTLETKNSNMALSLAAANELISQIRAISPDSRISIVVFHGSGYQMIPFVDGDVKFTGYSVRYDIAGKQNDLHSKIDYLHGEHPQAIIHYTIENSETKSVPSGDYVYDSISGAHYRYAVGGAPQYDTYDGSNISSHQVLPSETEQQYYNTNYFTLGKASGGVDVVENDLALGMTSTSANSPSQLGGGTGLEGGIYTAMNAVVAMKDDTSYLMPDGTRVTRIPVIVIQGDGATNHVLIKEEDPDVNRTPGDSFHRTDPWYDGGPYHEWMDRSNGSDTTIDTNLKTAGSGGNWWDIKSPIATACTYADSTYEADFNAVLQAAYGKAAVAHAYGKELDEVFIYTVGLGAKTSVLNPDVGFAGNSEDDDLDGYTDRRGLYEAFNAWRDNNTSVIEEYSNSDSAKGKISYSSIYDHFQTGQKLNYYIDQNNNTFNIEALASVWGYDKIGNDPASLERPEMTYHYSRLPENDVNGVKMSELELNYTRKYFFIASSSTTHASDVQKQLSEAFAGIAEDVYQVAVFVPVSGDNAAGVGDSITYQDPLGDYMEIKNQSILAQAHKDAAQQAYDMAMLVFGQMHGLVRAGVYDYQWNNKWMEHHKGEPDPTTPGQTITPDTTPFPMGWYRGDDPTTAERAEHTQSDGSGTYPTRNNAGTETYESAEEARAAGWVFRLNFKTLLTFVPIADAPEDGLPGGLSDQVKNTVYTCYRFAGTSAERNALHMNPIFGDESDIPQNIRDQWAEYAETGAYPDTNALYAGVPGVYRLSDIRVWIEDVGDYTDTSGVIVPNTGYDRSLYMNIPAAAIPTELATITLGPDGVTAYQTNLGSDHPEGTGTPGTDGYVSYEEYCYQSTPFRMFYAVGLEDDLILRDAAGNQVGVDLNAVSPEYIQAHTNPDNDNVWFISNYYSETRYSGYTTDDTSRTRGDPTVTFSPNIENRYYVFQKPLPLYAHAYRVTEDGKGGAVDFKTTKGSDFTWDDPDVDFTNGTSVWEDGNTGGANWQGGQFMGVYSTRTAFQAAYDNMDVVDGVKYITDSHGSVYEFVDGGIIFSEENLLDHVTSTEGGGYEAGSHSFSSDDYYFILLEFYVPEKDTQGTDRDGNPIDGSTKGKFVQWALARKGSEFGSGYASDNISNGDMLCWTDMNGDIDTNFAYMSASDTGDRTRGEPTWEKLTYNSDALRTYLKDVCGIPEDQMITNPDFDDTQEESLENPRQIKVLDQQVAYWLDRQKDPQVQAALAAANTDGSDSISKEEFNAHFQFALATRPGGIRSGDMSNNLQYKGAYNAETGYYDENNTKTSNTYYLPTISNNSGTDNNVIINNFLGNNGRLEIANQTLHVTKMLVPPDGFTLTDEQKENEVFNYQVSIQGVTGTRTAVKTEYNEYAESWERELGYIDVLTDNSDLVQTNDSTRALFVMVTGTTSIGTDSIMAKQVLWDETTGAYYYANENGALPTDADGNADPSQKVLTDVIGESNENLYYMYLPSNGTTGTSTEHVHRLYQAEDYEGTDKITEDLGRNGITTFVRPGDPITPSNPGAENRVSQREQDETHPAGTKTYWNLDAELIPKSEVDAAEATDLLAGSPGEPGGIAAMALESTGGGTWTHDGEGSVHSNHAALTYHDFFVRRPIAGTSETEFTAPYKSRTQYLTVTLNFGYNANENDGSVDAERALTPGDLYNSTLFGTVPNIDRLIQITAEFTLKHGEGLMFSGLSGSEYRFTEKLTEAQLAKGYKLQQIEQIQQNSTQKYTDVYFVNGDTGDSEEQVNYTNTIDPELFVLTKGLEDVDGNPVAVPPEQEFTFTVTFTPKADAVMTDVDNTLHYWKGNKDTWKSTEEWTDPADGKTYKMPENAPKLDEYESYLSGPEYRLATIEPDVDAPDRTYTVILKANEVIVFYGLIAGTDFTVIETKNDRYPVVADEGVNGYTQTGEIKRASADSTEIDPQKTHNRADFTNLMQSGVLTVEKYIHDDDRWSVTKSFEFTVTLTAKDGESLDSSLLSVTKISTTEEGEETNEPLTVTWNETKDDDKVIVLTATFKLTHGERIVINGIPFDTDYKVAESDSAGYNLEHVAGNHEDLPGSDGNFLSLERSDNSVSGTVSTDNKAVYLLFNNAKPLDMPFTGGIGRDMFFIIGAILLIASGIGFVVTNRKRRIRVK